MGRAFCKSYTSQMHAADPRQEPSRVAPSRLVLTTLLAMALTALSAAVSAPITAYAPPGPGFWLPSGLWLCFACTGGLRSRLAALIGAFGGLLAFAVTTAHAPLSAVMALFAADVVSAALGAWLFCGRSREEPVLSSPQDFVRLAVLAGGIGCLPSAMARGFLASGTTFNADWLTTSALGHAQCLAGVLLVPSVFLTWRNRGTTPLTPPRGVALAEAIAIGALLLVVPAVVRPFLDEGAGIGLTFATLPCVVWAGLRFGSRGAATSILIAALAVRGASLLSTPDPTLIPLRLGEVLRVLAGIGVLIGTGLVPALVVDAWDRARRQTARSTTGADVSERKRTEDALRQSEVRFRLVSLASNNLIRDWNLQTGEQWWNEACHSFFGTAPGEFAPTHDAWTERIHPEDTPRLRREFQTLCDTGGQFWNSEFRIRRPDGSYADVVDRAYLLRDPQGRPVRLIGATQDVSQRHRAEADRLVRAKLESTGVLAAGIAHDFNNLLMGVLLNAEVVGRGQTEKSDLIDALERIRETALAAKAVTSRLLAFAGGDASTRRRASLGSLARQAAESSLADSGFTATCKLPEDLWPVEIDERQMEQVIRNLVLNARESEPRDHLVRVEAANESLAAARGGLEPGDYVRLSVIDTGIGMDREIMSRIFDPYFTTKARGADKGMGLGLTICSAVMNRHHGAILVESEPGRGSAFHLFLPRCRDEQARPSVTDNPATPITQKSSRKVLVMDDEVVIRELLARTLRHLGYAVETAANGEVALELIRKANDRGERFNAAILDLTIKGGMGGREAARQLRLIDPAVKTIVISGYAFDNTLRDFSQHGFCDAIAKPFDVTTLKRTLERNGV